ncbi:class II fumarate hydratase [uncultured Ferrimonas sp.]|uniref:class II fumarate hydratase n=1 Tax=uncultured Ferrimonas sp. TaxID=432640 RepID=UPI00261C0168|nr:class II fumarate hydratase [uncultured Ferrimonas sp.]
MADSNYRTETDPMGEVLVPIHALYGAQTQRAVNNFTLSGITMAPVFIRALALIKGACAHSNAELGLLPAAVAQAISLAADEISLGRYQPQFPVAVFQTGSGTSSNMNLNEVIATLASRQLGTAVSPNDQVNMSQSSNDVIPSAIHLSAALVLTEQLLPALDHLIAVIAQKANQLTEVVKTGRTHLMDAMPLTFGQELGGWQAQLQQARQRLTALQPHLQQLALGGTAVGTGINAPAGFGQRACNQLARKTGLALTLTDNYFAAISAQDTALELSGQLKTLAVVLIKISNDLRWSNSGPLAGLGEIQLPALQPGSSMMPGKVNPVIPEAVAMAATQVIGNDTCVTLAAQSGNFQLNVMLPLIAHNLLQSLELLSNSARSLADKAIAGMTINQHRIEQTLARNPVLITALNQLLGYDQGAAIAKQAYAENRTVLDVAIEMTDIDPQRLAKLLDPHGLV